MPEPFATHNVGTAAEQRVCTICGKPQAWHEGSCVGAVSDARALRVHIDRCRGCCFCGNASVPGLRLCRHPKLDRPLPLTEEDLEADTAPAFCPARGCVVLAAGLPPSNPPPTLESLARRDVAAACDRSLLHDDASSDVADPLAGVSSNVAASKRGQSRRHVAIGRVAACDRSLLLDIVGPSRDVPDHHRCQRGPCRTSWPTQEPR